MKRLVFWMAAVASVSVQAAVSARQYVQRGLVAHWDALENNGYGQYDGTAMVWKDLKGNTDLTIVDAEATWDADALVPPQKNHEAIAQTGADTFSMAKYRAMEVCADYRSETATVAGYGSRAFSWHKAGFIGRDVWDTCVASLTEGTAYSVYVSYYANYADVVEHRLDGVPIAADSTVREQVLAADTDGGFEIGRSVNTWWSSLAPVHAVRIYNCTLEPDEVLINSNLDRIRYNGADGTTLAWPAGMRFANDEVQTFLGAATTETRSSAAANENRIAVSGGGETDASVEVWTTLGEARTLTPQPDDAHRYFYWSGDTDGLTISEEGVVTLPADGTTRTLVCHFVSKDSTAVVREWTGDGGTADWSDVANWEPAGAPGDDDVLTIPAGGAVTIGAATSNLSSLVIAGSVTVTNWEARIRAAEVRIAKGGVLTCTGAIKKEAMGRVWIQCEDLTVDAGGKIEVSECGYLAKEKPASGILDGYGPGRARSCYGIGAAHGGIGGYNVWNSSNGESFTRTKPAFEDYLYDDPTAPVEPGSSGRTSQWKKGGSGGGAVRIEATGCVTVNGSVLADGGDAPGALYSGYSHGTGGSGGSVYITCKTFAGVNGVIRAEGGDGHMVLYRPGSANSVWGYDAPGDLGDMAGGGGMIAIHYDAAEQTADLVKGMTISAAGGVFPYTYCCTAPTRANDDRYYTNADFGTLHFTDGKMLTALLGKGLSGQILGFTEWTCDSLDFTGGAVRFMGEGFKLKVNGDLKLSGKNVHLAVGGAAITNRVFHTEVWAGRQTVRLEVGGDLTVSGGARLDIRSAETNALATVGAEVKIGRTLTVGKDGWLYAYCDCVNGGAPKFAVSNLTVSAGGLLTAEGRGFAAAAGRSNGADDQYWNYCYRGYGPTCGFGNSAGAWAEYTFKDGTKIGAPATGGSHGGLGGLSTIAAGNNVKYAKTSDNPWRPVLPGSGGGSEAMALHNGSGGGVIFVEAQDHIQVDGTINADGGRTWSNSGAASGGAGGTIFLSSKTFAGADTGVLTARGGDIGKEGRKKASGAGGGGRIAVWTGEAYPGRINSRRIGKYEAVADCPDCDFLGTATASGGRNDISTLPEATGATLNGGDGTVRFAHVGPPQGVLMIVR